MLKRVLILVLALLICTGALFGCTKEPPNEKNDDTDESTFENDTEEDDGIGEYNFGGESFTILSRSETDYEHIGEMSGDTVSQKVYERNDYVSAEFNVDINVVSIIGDYDNRSTFVTAVRTENMSPTGAYDLVSTHSCYLGWMGLEGISHDLSTLPEIDFNKRFWNQNLYNELNVNGKCYMMIGDIGHTLYEYISVMFVNTKLIEDADIIDGGTDALYSLVDEGQWTWDKLYELSRDYGTGVDTPTYGLLFNTHAMRAAMMAQDAYLYDRDADGKLYMKLSADERIVSAVENLSQFFTRSNMYYATGWGTAASELNAIFSADQALFYGQTLGEAKNLQSMGKNYAVLPLPKFDEFQTDYYTICRDTVTGVMVMNCAKDLEMSGVITQALCYYGSELVTPEYYEKVLKFRYNSDPRSFEMIDKIRDSLTIAPHATWYDTGIDFDMFADIVRNGENTGIAGKYAEYSTRGNSELESFYEKLALLES